MRARRVAGAGMKETQKKQLAVGAGLALLLLAWRRLPEGRVTDEDGFSAEFEAKTFDTATEAAIDRLALAMLRIRQLMGADPNTGATKNPAPADRKYIEETLALARDLSKRTDGAVASPVTEEDRYALAKELPGDAMALVNQELYGLLGVDPNGENVATKALTPATEQRARQLIARWRPYSEDAVKLLFYQLDDAKALGEEA